MRCGFGPPRIIELRFSSTCVSLQSTRELTLVHRVVVLRDIVLSCGVAKDRYCPLCVNQDGEHGACGNGSDCVCGFGPPRIIELRFSSTCVSLQSTRECGFIGLSCSDTSVLSCRVANDRYCRFCVNQGGEHRAGGNESDCACGIWPPRVINLRFSSTCVSLQSTRECEF